MAARELQRIAVVNDREIAARVLDRQRRMGRMCGAANAHGRDEEEELVAHGAT
jgi:hypothetical protein